ncbi:MAG: cytochrome c biogenesis protein ResB, partial [Mycobacteriales bacterium]
TYDQYAPGAFVSPSSLQPFAFTLHRFTASYQANGVPKTFHAYVTATGHPGGRSRAVDIQVNHPLRFGSAEIYLLGHGYALHVILRDRTGRVWFDQLVPCIPEDLVNYLSSCVIKAPDTGATVTDRSGALIPLQIGVLAQLAPTAAFDPGLGVVSQFPALRRPRVVLSAFVGDLGLDSGIPQSVYSLSTARMTKVADAVLIPGAPGIAPAEPTAASIAPGTLPQGSVALPDGFTLQVAGLANWASFQVKDDPGKAITLFGAIFIVAGLLLSLRIRRRRVWLRASPAAGGRTLVEVGGLSRTDADGFAARFPDLAARLAGPDRSPAQSTKE